MIVGRTTSALVIHLINQTGARRKSFGPHLPVRNAKLIVKGKATRARGIVSGGALAGGADGTTTVYALPDLGLYEVVVVETD